MTRIFLIRHGYVGSTESHFNGPEVPLSERGRRQIQALTQDFRAAGIAPDMLVASPFTRTQESAGILSEAFGIDIETDKRLEEWRVGAWLGKPLKDFYAYTKYDRHPDTDLPADIEPLEECATRVQAVITERLESATEKIVFIVGHREPMASAVLKYKRMSFDSIHALHFPFASVWELQFERDGMPASIEKRFDRSTLE